MLVPGRVDLFLPEISRIGTSNFRTLVGHQPPEQHGLSIEAMPFYIKDLRPFLRFVVVKVGLGWNLR